MRLRRPAPSAARPALAAVVALLLLAADTQAQIRFTWWDFNNQPNNGTNPTPSLGTGTAGLDGGVLPSTPPFVQANGTSDPTADTNDFLWQFLNFPAQGTASGTAGPRYSTSQLAGKQNVYFAFDFRPSPGASRFYQLQFSQDGTAFTNIGQPLEARNVGTFVNDPSVVGANTVVNFAGVPLNPAQPLFVRAVAVFAPGTTQYVGAGGGGITSTPASYSPAAQVQMDWTGFGESNTWVTPGPGPHILQNAANWTQGLPASGALTSILTFGTPASGSVDVQNTQADFQARQITFVGGASYRLFGQSLLPGADPEVTLSAAGSTTGGLGNQTAIANRSTVTQTFDTAMNVFRSQVWEAATGRLVFNGPVNVLSNQVLTIAGASNTTFSGTGVISRFDPFGMGDPVGLTKIGTGILTVNGDNPAAPTVSINQGTLAGAGTIGGAAGAVTVAAGATVAPGPEAGGVGSLKLNNGATVNGNYLADVSGNTSDRLEVTGAVTIGPSSTLAFTGTSSATPGVTYTLVQATGALTGQFSNAPQGTAFFGTHTIQYGAAPGSVQLVPVPEPTTIAALGLVLLAPYARSLTGRRRRATA